ncbi:ABC transporter ATP-binding protein [Streptomyces pathocidini]|uniref:ABC transporter ATP-binding protein n=1 Tax=Streptomyces pathocidini TaxID=1650571 RepID=A0ABW7UJ15_9ACTN|nr:ABC transporter ATP-binding protein [Streptomyces pathocidini]
MARGLLPAAFTVAVGLFVAAVQHGGSVVVSLALVGGLFVLIQLLAPLHAQVGSNLGDRLASWLHDRLLDATTRPDGTAHLESEKITTDLTVARDFDLGISGPPMNLSMGMIAGGLVEAVAGLTQAAVLSAYHWWAAPLVGGAWAATHWLLRESSGWDRGTDEVGIAQRHAEYTYRLAVEPSAAKELRLFGLSEWTVARFAANRRRLVDLRWHATRLRQRPMRWTVAVLVGANGLLFWSLAADATAGAINAGEVIIYAQAALGTAALAFGGLNWALPLAAQSVSAVIRLGKETDSLGRLPSGEQQADGRPSSTLRFRDVHFSYPTDERPILNGLDLSVEAGTSLAIVGVNGAGKTTLVKLLCRLYDPDRGAIEVDGVDLRDFDLDSWRRQIAASFQDFIRYELPLRDNVAPLGAPDEVINAALKDARASDLADPDQVLARGYDGGTDLSGGQWQRVALARVLCAVRLGAGVVILDEPTAQLDVRAEAEIFDQILEATRGCTTILISHRFSTVRHADRICVLEKGGVVETGTHTELMARRGRYREMFELQASRFDSGQAGSAEREEQENHDCHV